MSEGVIYYNKGGKCIVRMIISMMSLRKHYNGPVTVFLEGEGLSELAEAMRKQFNVDVIYDANPDTTTYVRAVEVCMKAPYDVNIWMDADTLIIGEFSELFEKGRQNDLAIVHFAGWDSFGRQISKRIKRYKGLVPDEYIDKALAYGPAINCGVYSFPKNSKFLPEWLEVAKKGEKTGMFIPDEVACQVLLPKYKVAILPLKYNVSVRHDPDTKDKRIIHYHGRKHCKQFPLCEMWIKEYINALTANTCNIRYWVKEQACGGDRRLKDFMRGKYGMDNLVKMANVALEGVTLEKSQKASSKPTANNTTIVTAGDEKYMDILKETLPNWIKYKGVAKFPLIVYTNGFPNGLQDPRLAFLKVHPNVRTIEWTMPSASSQRERMLSAFVLGTARDVTTEYWLKLDADAFGVNNTPLIDDQMSEYDITGHKWGYTKPGHWIADLDKWAKGKSEFAGTKDIFEPGSLDGNRYGHARVASYIQFHKSEFVRLAAAIAGDRLPVPSHDTYLWYVAARLGRPIRRHNFKRNKGMTNKTGIHRLREQLKGVEEANKPLHVSMCNLGIKT
jgi:hypothetical protein